MKLNNPSDDSDQHLAVSSAGRRLNRGADGLPRQRLGLGRDVKARGKVAFRVDQMDCRVGQRRRSKYGLVSAEPYRPRTLAVTLWVRKQEFLIESVVDPGLRQL